MSFYTNVRAVGNQVFLRGVGKIGERFQKKVNYSPTLFVPVEKESKYKTLDGINVKPIQFDGLVEAREFIENHKDVSNYKIYGNDNFAFAFIGDEYPDEIEYDISKLVIANIDIEVASDDGFPHVESAASPIISIAVKFNDSFYVFGFGEPEGCKIEDTLKSRGILYVSCEDERELLECFLDTWNQYLPDIVTGWNVNGFDIPYLYNRLCRLYNQKTARRLSPWKYASVRKFHSNFGQEQVSVELSGIAVLDYYDLYKKFTYTNRESYRLDYIANVELGERKMSYSEFGSLHTLYKRDYHRFIEYNVRDVELVGLLEDKMKLIEVAVALAYSAKVNLGDVFSQVRMWDSICYHHLRKKNIAIPPRKNADKNVQFEGAYVKEPQVGIHNWVVSFDLNSLYPHLMMQYNISPEKLVPEENVNKDLVDSLKRGPWDTISNYDKLVNKEFDTSLLKRDNLTVTPNIAFFKRDSQGFLPEILEQKYKDRIVAKKKMIESQKLLEKIDNESDGYDHQAMRNQVKNDISKYNNSQMSMKILLNSLFGSCGNPYFRFYDLRIARAITGAGQLSIRWIESKINKYLNKLLETTDEDFVVASDTDSIYLCLDKLVTRSFGRSVASDETKKVVDFLDKVCSEKIEPYIDKCYDELADYMNACAQKMVMKREIIASKGLWTAKKRYVLNVYNSEGVSYIEPKLKIMGLEAVKSSTPEVCREKFKSVLKIIMNGSESDVQSFVEEFRQEFYSLPAEDVAFPRGVRGIKKYTEGDTYIKSTPIHVKGSIIYNKLVGKNNLDRQYQRIVDDDKIRFLYLKAPNLIHESVISIKNDLPKEFGLDGFVDYEKHFIKSFLDPIGVLLACVGWKAKPTSSLERFLDESKQ